MAHSRETEHYQLPLYDGTDIINPLTDFNNANEKIDETMYEVAEASANATNVAQETAQLVSTYEARIEALEQGGGGGGDNSKIVKTQAMIAPPFNPLKSEGYKPKEFVTYEDELYMFTSNHSGAWDATDVVKKTVYEMMVIITEV